MLNLFCKLKIVHNICSKPQDLFEAKLKLILSSGRRSVRVSFPSKTNPALSVMLRLLHNCVKTVKRSRERLQFSFTQVSLPVKISLFVISSHFDVKTFGRHLYQVDSLHSYLRKNFELSILTHPILYPSFGEYNFFVLRNFLGLLCQPLFQKVLNIFLGKRAFKIQQISINQSKKRLSHWEQLSFVHLELFKQPPTGKHKISTDKY